MSGEKLLPGRQLFCSFDFNHGGGKIPQLRRTHSRLYQAGNYVEQKEMSFVKEKKSVFIRKDLFHV